MKKILIVTLLVGMISSCTEPTVKSEPPIYTIPTHRGETSVPLKIIVIEGCEYFVSYYDYDENILCHKGNCKNPIHKGGNK